MTDDKRTDDAAAEPVLDDAQVAADSELDVLTEDEIDAETEAEIEAEVSAEAAAVPIDESAPQIEVQPQPPDAPPQRGARAIAVVSLLLAAIALVLAFLGWNAQRGRAAEILAAEASLGGIESAVGGLRTELSTSARELETTRGRIERIEQARSAERDQIRRLADELDRTAAELQRAEQAMASMRGLSASSKEAWAKAEAAYFLQSANIALQIIGDPDTALAALLAADDRLRSLGDPSLVPVRQRIADEIAAVRAIPRADIAGLALTLGSLAARVNLLPLRANAPEQFADEAGAEVDGSGWDRAVAAVSGALRGLVDFHGPESEVNPLMAPEQRFFLYRNLELQLEVARLAVVRGDTPNYRESLRSARRWLEDHFAANDSGVLSAIDTLAELEATEIDPPMPDVSGALSMLRRLQAGTAP